MCSDVLVRMLPRHVAVVLLLVLVLCYSTRPAGEVPTGCLNTVHPMSTFIAVLLPILAYRRVLNGGVLYIALYTLAQQEEVQRLKAKVREERELAAESEEALVRAPLRLVFRFYFKIEKDYFPLYVYDDVKITPWSLYMSILVLLCW